MAGGLRGNAQRRYCETCMISARLCTCGRYGTPRMPGCDEGGVQTAIAESRDAEMAEKRRQPFGFETVEEFHDG